MLRKAKNQKGFTLVELIVVIAILAVLALIAIPRMSGFQDNAKKRAVLTEAKTIASAIAVLATDGKTFVASEASENNNTFTAGEILGYTGQKAGGALALTLDSGNVTSFTWAKQFGADYFTITYTVSSDSFNDPVKTTGTLTPTTVDETF